MSASQQVPEHVPQLEDAELAEPLELDVEATAVDDEAEPDAEDFDDIDAEPDAPPDAPPQLPEIFSHLPVTGFGDVPAGPFFAQ